MKTGQFVLKNWTFRVLWLLATSFWKCQSGLHGIVLLTSGMFGLGWSGQNMTCSES
ncbi:hypothetical protein PRBEI_2001349700 [Prionailurus iriomotensis]